MHLDEAIQIVKQRYQHDKERIATEKAIVEKYGLMFNPSNLEHLTPEAFKSFLLYKNNKHWDGIHRQGNMITADMEKLRSTLRLLLDEKKPLKERLDAIVPKSKPAMIKGLGRAVLTPILMMVYPNSYAVYNSPAEEGMKAYGIYPNFTNASFSERYLKVNDVITRLAKDNQLSLWQIDEIWWLATTGYLPSDDSAQGIRPEDATLGEETKTTSEERYSADVESSLEDIIVANWEKIPAFKGLDIVQQDGDFIGRQYQAGDAGRIDLLCRDKETGDYTVIELKRGREGDKVVGQTLRYIGWVKQHLAKEGQKVGGIIITREDDPKLRYALSELQHLVQLKLYSISIHIT